MSRKFWNWIYLFIFFLPLSLCGLSHINMTTADHNVSNYHTETATVNYKYDTNDVNGVDDLVVGNIYKFDFSYGSYPHNYTDESLFIYCISFEDFSFSYSSSLFSDSSVASTTADVGMFLTLLSDDSMILSSGSYDIEFYYDVLLDQITFFGGSFYGVLFEASGITDFSYISACPQEYIPIESVTITESDTLVKWFDYEDDVLSVVDDMGYLLPVSAFYKLIFSTPNIWLKSIFLGADLVIWSSVCHIVMDLFMLLSHSLSRLFAKFGGAD